MVKVEITSAEISEAKTLFFEKTRQAIVNNWLLTIRTEGKGTKYARYDGECAPLCR